MLLSLKIIITENKRICWPIHFLLCMGFEEQKEKWSYTEAMHGVLIKRSGSEVAPENPLLWHKIVFFSELIEPEQANFQTGNDNYSKANIFLLKFSTSILLSSISNLGLNNLLLLSIEVKFTIE